MFGQPYAEVHVGIVPERLDDTARDLIEVLPQVSRSSDLVNGRPVTISIDGDGFTEWGEPWPEDADREPLHVVVRIDRPVDIEGEPTDGGGRRARQRYAEFARDRVFQMLWLHNLDWRFRLVDYVAVDFAPTWGEDSEVIGRWA